jgi:hypothetical protein
VDGGNERRGGRRAAIILPVPPAYQQVLGDRTQKYRDGIMSMGIAIAIAIVISEG